MQTLGVYIHIPFCVQKCVYCDFLSAPATREMQQAAFPFGEGGAACRAGGDG